MCSFSIWHVGQYDWESEGKKKCRHEGKKLGDSSSFYVIYKILINCWMKNNTSLYCLAHSLNLMYILILIFCYIYYIIKYIDDIFFIINIIVMNDHKRIPIEYPIKRSKGLSRKTKMSKKILFNQRREYVLTMNILTSLVELDTLMIMVLYTIITIWILKVGGLHYYMIIILDTYIWWF